MEVYNLEQMSQPRPLMELVPQNQLGVKLAPYLFDPRDKDEQTAQNNKNNNNKSINLIQEC